MRCWGVTAIVPVLCVSAFAGAPVARAADTLDVRVMISSPGSLIVDRGSADGVAVGDKVVLHLKDGTKKTGVVNKVSERSAAVTLDDKHAVVPVGSRGEIERAKRVAPPSPPPKPAPEKKPVPPAPGPAKGAAPAPAEPKGTPPAPAPAAPEHPDWQNKDGDFKAGMPLLSALPPVRPEERAPTWSGHVFSEGRYVRASNGGNSNSLVRLGGELIGENLFGNGGTLHAEGELNHRSEVDGGHGVGVLFHQLSYTFGGTRFDPTRIEVGRFLQYGMPEFGVLDGAEWSQRVGEGDAVGASIGWLPEPDDDFGTLSDFQLAAWYRWAADSSERLVATAGLQETLHDAQRDRDLLVAKLRWVPDGGWDFHGSAWVDFYGSSDTSEPFAQVTQAYVTLAKRLDDGGLDLTYRHLQFPDLKRDGEYTPITAAEIEDNHVDMLSTSGFGYSESHYRLHGQLGVWIDEDERGGSADAGLEFPELLLPDLTTDFTAFGSRGDFSTLFGGRVTCSLPADDGRWNLSYEFANHRIHGFSSATNDLVQHQVIASRSFHWDGGWSLNVNASATWWDTDLAWSAGLYIQKSF